MSQNLDATAINQIHALISAQGVNEIISKIGADQNRASRCRAVPTRCGRYCRREALSRGVCLTR